MPKRRARRTRQAFKKKNITSREKGYLFEDVVERYFRLLGYRVERNVRLAGLSGATHEIDVLIYKGSTKGVVEAKNYDRPVPKEWVMKASNVARDVGAAEVYVVSASGFTPDAVKVAEVLSVRLLTLEDMTRELSRAEDSQSLQTYYVKPSIGVRTVRERASKYTIKRFFKPVEEVSEVELLYHPFYAFEVEHTYVEEVGVLLKKEVEKKRKFTILASAVHPCLPVVEEDRVVLVDVKPVTKDEAELLEVLAESEKPLRVADLEDLTGWSRQKVSNMLSKLLDGGLVEYEEKEDERGRIVREYYTAVPHLDELEETYEVLVPERALTSGSPDGNLVDPKIPSANLAATISSLFTDLKVCEKRLVYLPVYRVRLISAEDGTYRYIHFLASTEEPLLLEGVEE